MKENPIDVRIFRDPCTGHKYISLTDVIDALITERDKTNLDDRYLIQNVLDKFVKTLIVAENKENKENKFDNTPGL